MEQPFHAFKQPPARFTTQRAIGLAAAVALQAGFIYALVTGLANSLIEKLPEELKAEVVQEKLPDKIPPPPPPQLERPPPPVVPPPDIVIANDAPVTTSIATVSKAPPTQQISSPVSIGRAHDCSRFYPELSQRLNESGTVGLAFRIDTDGNTKDVTIKNSSGKDRLDAAAVSCVTRWHYSKPAIQNGVPVEVPWQANVVFKQ